MIEDVGVKLDHEHYNNDPGGVALHDRWRHLGCGRHVITADQLLAHAVGDYILQSDWMAQEKTKHTFAALCHVGTYILPFLLLTRSPLALAAIAGSHFAIDRWRLSRYLVWVKNWMGRNRPWKECAATGYPPERPAWMAVWLLIGVDNIMHILCNGLALRYL